MVGKNIVLSSVYSTLLFLLGPLNVGYEIVNFFLRIQVLMMGEPFFDCQVGFVGCRALCLKSIMGVRDFEENMQRGEKVTASIANGRNGPIYLTIHHPPLLLPVLLCPSFFLHFCRMLCSSAAGTLSVTKA